MTAEQYAAIMDALAVISGQIAALHETADSVIAEVDDLRSIVARVENRLDELAET